jgi:ABC-2 type transport system ATP-binding protein
MARGERPRSCSLRHQRSRTPTRACYGGRVAGKPLVVTDLCRTFGAKVAVERLGFEVGPGEIVGLLGPNGAGKTTTISMVLGVLAPTSGTIVIDGVDLARHRSTALRRTNFAAVYATLPGNLTVAQNLRVFGMLYDVPALGNRIDELVELCDLRELRDTKCGLLSSGEQTRANLAKALLNTPRLLLLDEPTASLDPSIARDVRGMIRGSRARPARVCCGRRTTCSRSKACATAS